MPADNYNKVPGWRCWKIGEDLTEITKNLGLVPHKDSKHGPQDWVEWYDYSLHAEVRKQTLKNGEGRSFHQDGDTTQGANMACALVLWCSNTPTEYQRVGDNKIYQPEPYEIVISHNLKSYHRTPNNAPTGWGNRFVFRQRVALNSKINHLFS